MHIQNNVGKATQNSKSIAVHSKSIAVIYDKALGIIEQYADVNIKSSKRITSLVNEFMAIGFTSVMLLSPRDKKDKQGNVIKSKNTFISIEQFDGFKDMIVKKKFPLVIQRILAKAKKDRTFKECWNLEHYQGINWTKKANQVIGDCSRSLANAEEKARLEKAQAVEDAKVKADPTYMPKDLSKVSKKPSRNRTPQQVFIDNINQCIAIIDEHESALGLGQPADTKVLLRKAIAMFDNKSF